MKVEKLDRLCITVPNLEKGKDEFLQMLGIKFEKTLETVLPDGKEIRCAISSQGVELVENPENKIAIRSIHFRVEDLDEAQKWVEQNGGKVLSRFLVGRMEEMVCNIFGLRIILINYPGDDPLAALD